MKQVTIVIKCPDNYVSRIKEHIADKDRVTFFNYTVMGIDVTEIEE